MRHFLYLLFVLMVCLGIRALGAQDFYSQLERAFQEGRLPEISEMSGYWVGRCVRVEEKDKLLPAIFVHKLIYDEKKFPPNYLSMTSYYEQGDSKKFDKLTPKKMEEDPRIGKWLAEEQWNALSTTPVSVTNLYTFEKGHFVQREVKLYQSDFENILILRATETFEREIQERHLCYFNNRVGTDSGI